MRQRILGDYQQLKTLGDTSTGRSAETVPISIIDPIYLSATG
jgi:hypothetical protein